MFTLKSLAQIPLPYLVPFQLAGDLQRITSSQKLLVISTGNGSICVEIRWLGIRDSGVLFCFLYLSATGDEVWGQHPQCLLKIPINDLHPNIGKS